MTALPLPELWSELANGARLMRANRRAGDYAPAQQTATLDDPDSAHILPRLGFELRHNRHGQTAQLRTTWQRDSVWGQFLCQLGERLAELVSSQGNHDGSVTQTLPGTQTLQEWERLRSSSFSSVSKLQPHIEDAPLHVALALAGLPGPAWTVRDDGMLTRALPTWPLRYAPKRATYPLKLELKNRMLLDCICWAYLPKESRMNDAGEHEVVFLSLVGSQKKLKAGWATLMDSKREMLRLPTPPANDFDNPAPVLARRCAGKGAYRTFWNDAPLEESGLAHVAIQHVRVFAPRTAQPFIHLTGADGTPDLAFFMQQLDLASTLPLHPSWSAQLWDLGCQEKLIIALPSHGCQAYWIDAGDETRWATIAARCGGATQVRIETIGKEEEDDIPSIALVVTEVDAA